VKGKRFFFLLILLFACGTIFAQSREENKMVLKTEVSSNSISINDKIIFKLTIKGKKIPKKIYNTQELLKNFTIVRQSSSLRAINDIFMGKIKVREITWVLKPIKSGELIIPSLKISSGGKEYSTYPITVYVSEESIQSEDYVLKVIVYPSENDVIVNQQVVLTFSLITNISISSVIIKEPLVLSNVWVEEFPESGRIKGEQIKENGKILYKYIIKRYAIFPQRPGRVVIPPITFEISTSDNKTLYRKSNRLTLTVKKIAPSKIPKGFNYMIGSFWVKADVDKIKTKVGENIRYTIKISGEGNIKSVQAPKFKPNKLFNVYPPEVRVELNYEGNKITGTKEWSYLLIPQKRGLLTIPSFCFWYYLPKKDIFKNTCTRSFKILVESPFYSKSIKIAREDFPPPESDKKYLSHWKKPIIFDFNLILKIFFFLLFLDLIAFIFIYFFAKEGFVKKRKTINIKRKLNKIRKEKDEVIFSKKTLYILNEFFFTKYNKYLLDGGLSSLKEFFEGKEVKEDAIRELTGVIILLQSYLYSPIKNKKLERKKIIKSIINAISQLSEESKNET